jgi:glycosyltransferase involved in cell wall biosynthesis
MNIWLIQTGESLPFSNQLRKLRTGILADYLADGGHTVLWWASAFDHYKLAWVCEGDARVSVTDRITVQCLAGNAYKKHISLARFIDHRRVSWKFRSLAPTMPRPDLIVAATPAYDLAYQVSRYAQSRSIPLVVDIRDPWPDMFLDHVTPRLREVARLALASEFRMMRRLCSSATSLVAVSTTFLELGLRYAQRRRTTRDRVFYLGCKPLDTSTPMTARVAQIKEQCEGKFVVVFVGTFGTYHNPEILIDAAARLANEGIQFLIAGDGENRDVLQEKARRLDNVILAGWLTEPEIAHLLTFCHVGICSTPHRIDLFPNKGFLYFSAGLPVINAFQGDLRELTERQEIGCSYEPGDTDSLATHIRKLAKDRNTYQRMVRNVRHCFESTFRSDRIYTEYVSFLEELHAETTAARSKHRFATIGDRN